MKETGLKIKLFGDPALKKKAKPIRHITQNHRDILSEMARLMYADSGVGLAAPQVGINETMIVVDIGSGLYKLINPKISQRGGSQVNQEGCLSIPGVCIEVKRAKEITVQALDEFGKPLTIVAQDLFACVLQHEIEHLKGKLIVDYASFWEKLKIRRQLSALRQRAKNERLSQPKEKSCQLQL